MMSKLMISRAAIAEVAVCIIFFFIGAIPFGPIIARFKRVDLKKIGSGNIGATNVYRALGLKWAALVFVLDALKGAACAFAGLTIFPAGMTAGLLGTTAVLGHIFSPYLKFRGGKGVATGFGVMAVFAPIPSLITLAIWGALVSWKKLVSLASIIAAVALPALVAAFKGPGWIFYTSLIVVGLVILSHWENILRLLRGQEKPVQRENS